MKVSPLSYEEQLAHGCTHKVEFDYTDFTDTAGLTKTMAIFPLSGTAPIGTVVERCVAKVVTAFVGTTTLTISVGDDGAVDRNLTASNFMAAAGTWYHNPVTIPAPFNAANTVDIVVTATVTNLSTLTAGAGEIYLQVYQDSKLK